MNQALTRTLSAMMRRIRTLESRLASAELALRQARANRVTFIGAPNAVPAVPGSPVVHPEEIVPVKILQEDPERPDKNIYIGRVQSPKGLGQLEDYTDRLTGEYLDIPVRAYPRSDTGDESVDYPPLQVGTIVSVRWEGRDENESWYHVLGGIGYPGTFFKVTKCLREFGLAKVRRIGLVGFDTDGNWQEEVPGESPEEVAVLGVEGWHETGDVVCCQPFNGAIAYFSDGVTHTVTASWLIVDKRRERYGEEPGEIINTDVLAELADCTDLIE